MFRADRLVININLTGDQMKKRILAIEIMVILISVIAIFAVTLYFMSRDNPRTVLVGVEDFAPFISLNKDGEMVGISALILQRIAVNENLRLVPTKPKPLDELLRMLEAGEIEERLRSILYQAPAKL